MVAIIQRVKPCGDEMGLLCGDWKKAAASLRADYGPSMGRIDQYLLEIM